MFEEIGVFYRGLVLGLMFSAPVGPVGLLCVRRTIQKGLLIGFATGIGAACADTLFSVIAVLGVTAILDFMHQYDAPIRILGGGILMFGAWHTWHDKPHPPQDLIGLAQKVVGMTRDDSFKGSLKAFLSGLAITLTNPVTIFAVLAMVAAFGNIDSEMESSTLVAGVFFGAAGWWLSLSGGISLLRHHFTESRIIWLNRITAILLFAIAVWAVISGIRHLIQH